MLEYWNIGMMESDANLKVMFSTSGIASIVHCIIYRVQNVRFVLLSLFQSSITPLFHGMTVNKFQISLARYTGRTRRLITWLYF